jgi:hypothetical protein
LAIIRLAAEVEVQCKAYLCTSFTYKSLRTIAKVQRIEESGFQKHDVRIINLQISGEAFNEMCAAGTIEWQVEVDYPEHETKKATNCRTPIAGE